MTFSLTRSRRTLLAGLATTLVWFQPVVVFAASDARNDASPWGMGSGAEWSREFPRFNPLLKDAGFTWLRYFPEWQTIQPKQGEWDWTFADALVADAKKNNLKVLAPLGFAARWATTDGSTRTVPLKDNADWARFTEETVRRYKNDIRYWEVWNEFNGSFSKAPQGQKPRIYADLVRSAHAAAKKADPDAQVGLTVANFDVGFLDATIKAGAADHFEFICVHPYENLKAVLQSGGEIGYLSLAGSLRKMLRDNGQDENTPLWITEIGVQSTTHPDQKRDAGQADALVWCYVLSLVQGFDKVFWFEARGPAYGKNTDHGVIRHDWSLRPVYHAHAAMAARLGPEPKYLGWLHVGDGAYGFVFEGAGGPVLVTWAPQGKDGQLQATFAERVRVFDVLGKESVLAPGHNLSVPRSPIYVTDLPSALVAEAKANKSRAYPWGADYTKADTARVHLGVVNREEGLRQTKLATTETVQGLDWSARKSTNLRGGEGHYIYFRTDPTFAGFGDKGIEITVVARRATQTRKVGVSLVYESLTGYKKIPDSRWEIPEGEEWHEHTWRVSDANFVGAWGWNFRTDAGGSAGEFEIREVRVKKLPAAAK